MKYWFFAARLPALLFEVPALIHLEAFREEARIHLTPEDLADLDAVLDGKLGHDLGSAGAKAWREFETALRSHAAGVRAGRLHVDPSPWVRREAPILAEAASAVVGAFAKTNPDERERALDRARWTKLEEIAASDPFGPGQILAYGLQLTLAERWHRRSDDAGGRRLDQAVDDLLTAAAEGT